MRAGRCFIRDENAGVWLMLLSSHYIFYIFFKQVLRCTVARVTSSTVESKSSTFYIQTFFYYQVLVVLVLSTLLCSLKITELPGSCTSSTSNSYSTVVERGKSVES